MALRELHQPGRRRVGEARPRAHRAAPAVLRIGVVELLLQDTHETAAVAAVGCHRGLLGTTQGGHLLVPFGVVAPVAARHRLPAVARAPDRALHVEDLQHRLDPSLAEVHDAHQLAHRAPIRAGGLQVAEHRSNALLRRERLLDEEVLDATVLIAAQQDHVCVVDAPPGAADLLVVGHDRARRLEVHDEGQVGLVVTHAERTRGDHGLDLVVSRRSSVAIRSPVSCSPL